jgi:hypothetical protein
MNFLDFEVTAGPDNVIEVELDAQANVMLLDNSDFHSYRTGGSFHYIGGLATKSPFVIRPPRQGQWHVVVDRGGYGGTLRASCAVL